MAFSEVTGKSIIATFGAFPIVIGESVIAGDLLTFDTSNDEAILADEEASEGATCVACEDGDDGDTIWAAMGVIYEAPATESSGVWSAGSLAASGDIGDPLYLDGGDEEGKASESAGSTYSQLVGYVIATNRVLLIPQVSLSGASLTLSGNLSVGGTLGVTGNTTLTGTLTCNNNVTIASGKNLTLTKGTLTSTEGDVTLAKGDLTLTLGDATLTEGDLTLTKGALVMTAGQIMMTVEDGSTGNESVTVNQQIFVCELAADSTYTLPTAAAGLMYAFVHKSGNYTLTVKANTSDKIIDPADGGVHDKIADDKGLDCHITFIAADDTNWVCTSVNGDWTGA